MTDECFSCRSPCSVNRRCDGLYAQAFVDVFFFLLICKLKSHYRNDPFHNEICIDYLVSCKTAQTDSVQQPDGDISHRETETCRKAKIPEFSCQKTDFKCLWQFEPLHTVNSPDALR